MKVLVIMLNNPGDIVMATSVVNRLINEAHDVSFLISEENREIFENRNNSFNLLLYPRITIKSRFYNDNYLPKDILNDFIFSLKRENFDFILNYYQGNESSVISILASNYETSKIRGKFLDYDGIFKIKDINTQYLYSIPFDRSLNNYHVIDIYNRIYNDNINNLTPMFLSINKENRDRLKKEVGENFVLMHISAAWESKRYPPYNWAKLIDLLKIEKIVFTATENEKRIEEEIYLNLEGDSYNIISMVGKTNKGDIIDLVSLAKVVITGDTFIMHIAAALNKKIISLFSPSNFLETGPYVENAFILKSKDDPFFYGSFDEKKGYLHLIEPELIVDLVYEDFSTLEEYNTYVFNTFFDDEYSWRVKPLNYKNTLKNKLPNALTKKIYEAFILKDYNKLLQFNINEIDLNLFQYKNELKELFKLREKLFILKEKIRRKEDTRDLLIEIDSIEKNLDKIFNKDLKYFLVAHRITLNSLANKEYIDGYIQSINTLINRIIVMDNKGEKENGKIKNE